MGRTLGIFLEAERHNLVMPAYAGRLPRLVPAATLSARASRAIGTSALTNAVNVQGETSSHAQPKNTSSQNDAPSMLCPMRGTSDKSNATVIAASDIRGR